MATLVVTFTYDSDEQGFVATAGGDAQLLFSGAVGNPAGSLRSVVSGNGASGSSHWDLTTTYEALGVPINSTITGIQAASLDSFCNTFTSGAISGNISGPATLTDGITVATLTGSRAFNAVDGGWSTDGGIDLTGLSKPSSNSITLRINSTLINQSVIGALIRLFQDNLTFTLVYNTTPQVTSGGVRPRIGARSPGQIGKPGPVPPGKSVLWQYSIDQKRQSDTGLATGSAAITLGGLTTAGTATFTNVGPSGFARMPGTSPGEIGRVGPLAPGLSRFWQRKIILIRQPTLGLASSSGDITLGSLTVAGIATDTSTATGAVTLGGLTVAGVATFTSTALVSPTINLGGLVVAGVATDTATSTGAITLGGLIVGSAATGISTSTGAVTLGSLTAAGTGNFITSGGGVVPRLGARSRGKIGRPGPGKPGRSVFWESRITPIYQADIRLSSAGGGITLGSLTVAGVASGATTGIGGITLGALAAAGIAAFSAVASGPITLGSLVVAGVSPGVTATGTGPILLSPLVASGAASTANNATGGITLGSLIVAGVGRLTDSATGTITLGSLIVAGVAGISSPATGVITLAPLTVAGVATATQLATTGFGTITLGALAVSGSGTFDLSATGNITLAPLVAEGVAGLTTTADSIDILLAPLNVAGIGIFAPDMVSGGAGVIALAPLVASGLANVRIAAVGSIILSSLTAEGTGTSEGGDLSIKIYVEPRMAVVIDGDDVPIVDPRAATVSQP